MSNRSDQDVYFDNFKVGIQTGNIIEENHYYAYGLKIAAISSRKFPDAAEGNMKNNHQYQGAFNELDDDIGWNDFALRNYDAQIGRWMQQDPYQEFASPYVGMGNDPANNTDPSGGSIPLSAFCPGTSAASIFLSNVVSSLTNALSAASPVLRILSYAYTATSTAANVVKVFEVASTLNNNGASTGVGEGDHPNYYKYRVGDASKNSYDDDLTKTYYPKQRVNNNPYDEYDIYEPDQSKFETAFKAGTILENERARKEASELLDRFKNGDGGEKKPYTSRSEMSKILSEDDDFQDITREFQKKLLSYLKTKKSLDGFDGDDELGKARKGKYFKSTWFMHTVLGGFQEMTAEIFILNNNRIGIRYTVKDHFGAGKDDAGSHLPGLPSLYWLQHNSWINIPALKNKYKPFIWSIEVDKVIKY